MVATEKRKKAQVRGGNICDNIFPEIKVLPRKNVASISLR
jgi:hypothetical protein